MIFFFKKIYIDDRIRRAPNRFHISGIIIVISSIVILPNYGLSNLPDELPIDQLKNTKGKVEEIRKSSRNPSTIMVMKNNGTLFFDIHNIDHRTIVVASEVSVTWHPKFRKAFYGPYYPISLKVEDQEILSESQGTDFYRIDIKKAKRDAKYLRWLFLYHAIVPWAYWLINKFWRKK